MKAIILLLVLGAALADSYKIPRNCPLFKQYDEKWGSIQLGSSSTIGRVGCAMCSVASGVASLGKTIYGVQSSCESLNRFLKNEGGYYGNLLIWGVVDKLKVTAYEGQISGTANIQAAIRKNKIVVLLVNNGRHWVLATGFNGNTFTVNDSGYDRTTYSADEVDVAAVYKVL